MLKLKKWEYGLIVGILFVLIGLAYAQYAYESITVSNVAKTLTSATYARANRAFITVESNPIRYTLDGVTVPNSGTSIGHVHPATNGLPIILENADEIRNFMAVRAGASDAIIKVTYYSK